MKAFAQARSLSRSQTHHRSISGHNRDGFLGLTSHARSRTQLFWSLCRYGNGVGVNGSCSCTYWDRWGCSYSCSQTMRAS